MKFKSLHPGFKLPALGSKGAGAYDIFMPESGRISGYVFDSVRVPLGFAAEVPAGHVALILPRSGAGAEYGLELENTAGVIDSDYRGEWAAELHLKKPYCLEWKAGDRLLQFLLIPVLHVELEVVEELGETERGAGGFGSTDLAEAESQVPVVSDSDEWKSMLQLAEVIDEVYGYGYPAHTIAKHVMQRGYRLHPPAAQPKVPEGYVLVPVEPTDAMIEAGCKQHECHQHDPWYSNDELTECDCKAIYTAMLNASKGEGNA